jgi:tryptophan-rich sensory protein
LTGTAASPPRADLASGRTRARSLRQQLLTWLAIPLAVLLVSGTLFSYWVALRSATITYDRALLDPALALAEILVLWGVLAAFQRLLWREDRVAGALWAPYLLWVSFATGLNATLWWLNRG